MSGVGWWPRSPAVALVTLVVSAATLAACDGGAPPEASRPTVEPTPTAQSGTSRSSPPSSSAPGAGPVHVEVRLLPWRLPEPLGREAVMATRTGVVVAGGLVAGDASTAHAYRLDLRSGRAKRLPDLAVPVHDVGSAVARGVAEVVGGGNATEQDVIQTAGADGIWRISAHLPERRSDLVAVTVGDHTFVVGGYDGVSMALASVQTSWKGGPFHAFARLRLPVRYPAVAVAAGAIWVFGGERGGQEVDAIQRIDLHSGRVRIAGHLLGPLGHASAVRFGSRILLVGGRTGQSVPSAAMWWFDPARRSLRPAGALPTPLADSAVVRAGTAAYLVGGETPALSDRVLRLRVVPGP